MLFADGNYQAVLNNDLLSKHLDIVSREKKVGVLGGSLLPIANKVIYHVSKVPDQITSRVTGITFLRKASKIKSNQCHINVQVQAAISGAVNSYKKRNNLEAKDTARITYKDVDAIIKEDFLSSGMTYLSSFYV